MSLPDMKVRQHQSIAETRQWWNDQQDRIRARLGLPAARDERSGDAQ